MIAIYDAQNLTLYRIDNDIVLLQNIQFKGKGEDHFCRYLTNLRAFIVVESDINASTLYRLDQSKDNGCIEDVTEYTLGIGLIKDVAILEDKKAMKFHSLFSTLVGIFSAIVSMEMHNRNDFYSSYREVSPSNNYAKELKEEMLSPSVIFKEKQVSKNAISNAISLKDLENQQRISEIKNDTLDATTQKIINELTHKITQRVNSSIETVIIAAKNTVKSCIKFDGIGDKVGIELEKTTNEGMLQMKEMINEKIEVITQSEAFDETIQAISNKFKDHIESTIKTDMVSICETIVKQIMSEMSISLRESLKDINLTYQNERNQLQFAQDVCMQAVEVNLKLSQQLEELKNT